MLLKHTSLTDTGPKMISGYFLCFWGKEPDAVGRERFVEHFGGDVAVKRKESKRELTSCLDNRKWEMGSE